MYKLDLHTHSKASPDGGITDAQYARVLESGKLDCIAITDHNTIDFAVFMAKAYGDRIIVGEEIMSAKGEIIGLFLKDVVQPGMSPLETVKAIKDQGGIVYIPHPFETVRKGLSADDLDELVDYVDIIEVCNGRAFFQNRSQKAALWARLNDLRGVASSDAHGAAGLGPTFTSVSEKPTRENFLKLLKTSVLMTDRPTVRALLYPKYHRLHKKVRRNK